MQIHQLKKPKHLKERKRIGRGGKRGTYSGRGQKGQKSRAGHRIKPQVRELLIRIPKRRGFRFKSLKPKPVIFNLADIDRKFQADEVVDLKNLSDKKMLKQTQSKKYRQAVKILASGNVSKALIFKGLLVSEPAKEKILKAGGKVL